MSNHYHLLVQTPRPTLARGMRQLNGVYAQSLNRRYGRDGHLFQGRYLARLVQADEHLLATVRYIVRNPLRAGLCERIEAWRWSSHLPTLGARPPGVLALDVLLSYFGASMSSARARYLALVEEDSGPEPADHRLVEGDASFIAAHIEQLQPSPEHPRAFLQQPRRPLTELVISSGDVNAIADAYLAHGYTLREIATHLGCGITTVHRRVRASENARSASRATDSGKWKT
jgi:hypothetical protein